MKTKVCKTIDSDHEEETRQLNKRRPVSEVRPTDEAQLTIRDAHNTAQQSSSCCKDHISSEWENRNFGILPPKNYLSDKDKIEHS